MEYTKPFTYSSGSHKDTDATSILASDPSYWDVPTYMRLSENGYTRMFNNHQRLRKEE
jgi:hypothetical protein